MSIPDIKYRNIPKEVYKVIANKQAELKILKGRHHGDSEVITILLMEAYVRNPPGKDKQQ